MKILHFINSLATGGAEKLLLESLPLYEKHGITADLLLLNKKESPFLKKLKEDKCCSVFSLGATTVYNPFYIFKIIPFLKEYDIIHVHLFPAQYFAVFAKMLSRAKVKLIFTEHSINNRRFNNKRFKLIDRFIYNHYDHIIAITLQVKEAILAHTGISSEKIGIINNGILLQKIYEAHPYCKSEVSSSIKDPDQLIIQVSSFQEPKDQLTVIKSLLHLPFHFKIAFVGDGVVKDKMIRVSKDLELEDRVFFVGIRTDIPQLLKTADIVVLSSKYEGLSLSSIEGMASGKPFLASDVPGLNEVVSGAGILFPVGDEKKLAEEILHLSNDSGHYAATAQRCLVRAKNYDISKMVAAHINLYKEILKIQ